MAIHQQQTVDMAIQQQQNNGSSDGAAGKEPSHTRDLQKKPKDSIQQQQNDGSSEGAAGEKPLYTRYQDTAKESTSKGTFISKFRNWFSKKPNSTDAQQSTGQSQLQDIKDEAPGPASVDTSEVHGYENEELWLVRCLIKPDDGDFKAIGIFGMPEVGKTALARLVFENDYVKHHFLPRIWVSVSEIKIPNKKQQVFETILRKLDVGDKMIEDFAQRGVAALLYAVHLKLAGKRYLIVLDGVTKDDDCCRNLISPADVNGGENKYEEFSFAFPKGSGGAVIVTSRRKETAEDMVKGKTEEKILYTPRPIEDPHSCFLIYNSILKEKVKTIKGDSEREILEREIRMKSGGLPMAARLMAAIKNSETDPPQNGRPNEQDHQNVRSGAENNEHVPLQDQ